LLISSAKNGLIEIVKYIIENDLEKINVNDALCYASENGH